MLWINTTSSLLPGLCTRNKGKVNFKSPGREEEASDWTKLCSVSHFPPVFIHELAVLMKGKESGESQGLSGASTRCVLMQSIAVLMYYTQS